MGESERTGRKLALHLTVIALLLAMLTVTTWALVSSLVSVENNLFEMGTVCISLNDGQRVFDGSDMNVEPGHSLVRTFTVANTGTARAYYRLYLENITGTLKEALHFEIYDGQQLLFQGTAAELCQENPCQGGEPLEPGEVRVLTAVVKMEESAGNVFQDGGITFDMTAEAVQSKNNPQALFQ